MSDFHETCKGAACVGAELLSGLGREGPPVLAKYAVWGAGADGQILVTISAAATGGQRSGKDTHSLVQKPPFFSLWLPTQPVLQTTLSRPHPPRPSAWGRPLPPAALVSPSAGAGRRGKGNETPQHWAIENNHCLFKGRLCPVPRQELSVSPPFSSC